MKFGTMTWPEVSSAAPGAVAVLPIAATEQHGPHLPVSTDACIGTALAEGLEQRCPGFVMLCPTLSFGASHHHLAFGGTLSLRPELFASVVMDLVQSLLSGGFRQIVLLNSHGGNIAPVRLALAQLALSSPPSNIALATYWEMAGTVFAGDAPMESPALSHACEYESSLMLHLHPALVHLERADRSKSPAANAWIGWEEDVPYRGISLARRTENISSNGASGEPHLGTAAKGAHLLSRALDALEAFVRDFRTWPMPEDMRHV